MRRIWPWISLVPFLGLVSMVYLIHYHRPNFVWNARNRRLFLFITSLVILLTPRSIDPFCEWFLSWQACVLSEHGNALLIMLGCWNMCFHWCCIADAFATKTTHTKHNSTDTRNSIYLFVVRASAISSLVAISILCIKRQQWAKQIITANQSIWLIVMAVYIIMWIIPVVRILTLHISILNEAHTNTQNPLTVQQQQPTLVKNVILGRNRILGFFGCFTLFGFLAIYARLRQTFECIHQTCAFQTYQLVGSPANQTFLHVQMIFALIFIYFLTIQGAANSPSLSSSPPVTGVVSTSVSQSTPSLV